MAQEFSGRPIPPVRNAELDDWAQRFVSKLTEVPVTATVTNPGQAGTPGTINIDHVVGGVITSVSLGAPGTGYAKNAVWWGLVTGGGGTGAIVMGTTDSNGNTNSVNSVPLNGGGGYAVTALTTYTTSDFYSPLFSIPNPGGSYIVPPTIELTGAGGIGATAVGTLTNGQLTGVSITNPGNGAYTSWTVLVNSAPNYAFYGLTPGQAMDLTAAQADYTSALSLSSDRTNRSAAKVEDSRTKKQKLIDVCRPIIQQIANNPTIPAESKYALEIRAHDSLGSPTEIVRAGEVLPPKFAPRLTFLGCDNLVATIGYDHGVLGFKSRKKPKGVIGVLVGMGVSRMPIQDAEELLPARLEHHNGPMATRTPFQVRFDINDANKQCYMAARSLSRRGADSPWSPIIEFTVVLVR